MEATQAFNPFEDDLNLPEDNHNLMDMSETIFNRVDDDRDVGPTEAQEQDTVPNTSKVGSSFFNSSPPAKKSAEKSAFLAHFRKSPTKTSESSPTKTVSSPSNPAPAQLSADMDSNELNIRITVDPTSKADLQAMSIKISTKDPKSPIQVESTVIPKNKVPVTEARNIFASIMKGGEKKTSASTSSTALDSNSDKSVAFARARKNGYVTPTNSFDYQNSSNNRCVNINYISPVRSNQGDVIY